MKVKQLVFAVLLSFALCAPAMAEVKTFGDIKVDVPTGWTTQEVPGATGVALMSPDKTATISIAQAPMAGKSLEAIANESAAAMGGKATKDEDGYMIEGNMGGAKIAAYILEAEGGNFLAITLAGEHKDFEAILNSIE